MTIHCSALVVRGCWLNLSSVSEAVVLSAAELHVQKNKVEPPPNVIVLVKGLKHKR